MWIVERENKKQSYVSGIFKKECELKKFLSSIRTKYLDGQKIVCKDFKYPFYIVEKEDGFKYHQSKKSIKEEKDYTLYTIEKDFASLDVGGDIMGILEHDHIE